MMELGGFPAWQIFAVIGVVLAIAEVTAPGFILLPIGLGFLLGALLSTFTDNVMLSWAFLFISLVVVYVGFSKWAKKNRLPAIKSGIEALIGQKAALIESIQLQHAGQIKVSGDTFVALSVDGNPIPAPAAVEVIRFEGNKAIVRKIQ
jgi:membrane protein implicated in regulation of membrane protease activity